MPEPLSEERLGSKKVCEVCGREKLTWDSERPAQCCGRELESRPGAEACDCYRLAYEREKAKAAILTPEVLRLIEAREAYGAAFVSGDKRAVALAAIELHESALPFEKPAEPKLHTHAWVRFELCERGGHYVTGTGATCHPSPCAPAELPKKGGE